MKALILAAGYGTRLLPHTHHTPKPLFPVSGSPLIDLTIRRLIEQGITGIIINVHHLHQQIEHYIQRQKYPIPVHTRYEPRILGTGGAIKNVADFLEDRPFLMINSDILTDIDIGAVISFHRHHPHPATLVMHDYPTYNKVWCDENDNIIAFSEEQMNMPPGAACLAFTGIQVLDPPVMNFIPDSRQLISIIDVYQKMIASGLTIKAYTSINHYWRDIGTPESYSRAVFERTAPAVFEKAFGSGKHGASERTLLAGDGSDRRWYRITSNRHSLILGDHGIRPDCHTAEVDAFINIGMHLFQKNIAVPEIFYADPFSGHVYVKDLGDINLQSVINREPDSEKIISRYHQVIDRAIDMWLNGLESFDPAWTYQSRTYDRNMILDKECRYFVEAFLNIWLNMDVSWEALEAEFQALAHRALENAVTGFMHRDLQSRNIMIFEDTPFFIDFQGGRIGPVQYDLASLLTDPYVHLNDSIQEALLDYSIQKLAEVISIDPPAFAACYRYCSITRILQSLGAFGHLSKAKNKPFFEQFIPIALTNLHARLQSPQIHPFPVLTETVKNALILSNSTP